MDSFGSNYITAFDLAPCLANGFMNAAKELAGRSVRPQLHDDAYYCHETDVVIHVTNDP